MDHEEDGDEVEKSVDSVEEEFLRNTEIEDELRADETYNNNESFSSGFFFDCEMWEYDISNKKSRDDEQRFERDVLCPGGSCCPAISTDGKDEGDEGKNLKTGEVFRTRVNSLTISAILRTPPRVARKPVLSCPWRFVGMIFTLLAMWNWSFFFSWNNWNIWKRLLCVSHKSTLLYYRVFMDSFRKLSV